MLSLANAAQTRGQHRPATVQHQFHPRAQILLRHHNAIIQVIHNKFFLRSSFWRAEGVAYTWICISKNTLPIVTESRASGHLDSCSLRPLPGPEGTRLAGRCMAKYQPQTKKPQPFGCGFYSVAGAGLEPATSGL